MNTSHYPPEHNWQCFFTDFNRIAMNSAYYSPVDKWRCFFSDFKRYRSEMPVRRVPVVNLEDTGNFFHEFSRTYASFVQSGGRLKVWDVAGVGTDEVRNCAVLAWLLDCHGSHGQGEAFLRCFLESLSTEPTHGKDCAAHLPQPYQINAPYRTTLEKHYNQGGIEEAICNSRVDIVIENASFLLFVEVKIYAGDTGNQLERYKQILKSKTSDRKRGLIFLAPTRRADQKESDEDIVCLSWQHLASHFEAYLDFRQGADAKVYPQPPLWLMLVRQFCQHIRTF